IRLRSAISPSLFVCYGAQRALHSFPTRRSSDLILVETLKYNGHTTDHSAIAGLSVVFTALVISCALIQVAAAAAAAAAGSCVGRSEEHTSELQSRENLVCRLLLEKKKPTITRTV